MPKTRENFPNLLIPFTCTSSAEGVSPPLLDQLPVSTFLTSYYLEAAREGESTAGGLGQHVSPEGSPQGSPPGGHARPALRVSPSGSPRRVAFLSDHVDPGEARELFSEQGRGPRARQWLALPYTGSLLSHLCK